MAEGSGRFEIRRRWSGDLPGCVGALAEVHRSDGYPVVWSADPARWLVESDQLASWVAVSAATGEIAGHVALNRGSGSSAGGVWAGLAEGREPDGAGAVSRLYVAPAWWGNGLGERLLATAVGQARAWGLRPVLDVVAENEAAVALYHRTGWELLLTVDQTWSNGMTVTVHCFAAGDGA
ncbi:GNAT family N-acetyltransferase [Kitasatospora sp. NBC_01287]|uniref:GNAT family N-acetyltransferase n=1 Tax=Kitasatospora sp. NBC_01287 TaxID=2903573 RepID=UPI00225861C2|nr:GNAT family N-acetyltransferase [Kitasatospora sp. NBC_01287]MCX4745520.1 GNAT family N-acetyltransferase [Kitasatospora sp. NBC_01287]